MKTHKPLIIMALLAQGCATPESTESRWTAEQEAQLESAALRLCQALPESCGDVLLDQFYLKPGEPTRPDSDNMVAGYSPSQHSVFIYEPRLALARQDLQNVALHEMFHFLGAHEHQDTGSMTHPIIQTVITEADLLWLCANSEYTCEDMRPERRL